MTTKEEASAAANKAVQFYLDSVNASDVGHLVNMLMTLTSAVAHVVAAVADHECAVRANEMVADYMRTKPKISHVEQVYGETEKTPTVEGNNTVN